MSLHSKRAGFGIDAGLPDYDGVHAMVDEGAARFGMEPHETETSEFYHQHPRHARGLKARVINIFLNAEPHTGYSNLRQLLAGKNVLMVTSNIDDHFHKAGFDEQRLWEIHGRLSLMQCIHRSCNARHALWTLPQPYPREECMQLVGDVPRCKYCGDCARPNVCFADDNSFCNSLRNVQRARFEAWVQRVASRRPRDRLREPSRLHGTPHREDGSFGVQPKEIRLPKVLNGDNMTLVHVNPERNLPMVPGLRKIAHHTGAAAFFEAATRKHGTWT